MKMTTEQLHMANDLYLFAITTGSLYDCRPPITAGEGAWLGHATKALTMYEKEVGHTKGMSHSFVIGHAAGLIKGHYEDA